MAISNKSSWKDTAELIGIAAIVASLIFVGLQLKQEQNIAIAQTIQGFAETNANLRMGGLEFAEILAKGNRGEELSEGEWIVLRDFVQVREGTIALQRAAIRNLGGSFDTLPLRFAVYLYRNPAAREAWVLNRQDTETLVDPLRSDTNREDSYEDGSGALRRRVQEYLDKLDARADALTN
jgi:hypothetical protein